MNAYKDEWIELLLKQNFPGWLVASDRNHIFINIPDDQDLEKVLSDFKEKAVDLKKKIKSKPEKLGFFIGNSVDSKFHEL
ncbi:MAG: hypothetical protein EOO43_07645 [Flavobacterium sp.]|nr:MAG: hypothetical protein EOO43_07645 [Flavobacterium sp.]